MFTTQTSPRVKKRKRDEDAEAAGLERLILCFGKEKWHEICEKAGANKDIFVFFRQVDCVAFLTQPENIECNFKILKSLIELLIALHEIGCGSLYDYTTVWDNFKKPLLFVRYNYIASNKIDDFLRVVMAEVYFNISISWLSKESRLAVIELFHAYPKQSFELAVVESYFQSYLKRSVELGLFNGDIQQSDALVFTFFIPHIEHVSAISLWVRIMKQLERAYNNTLKHQERDNFIPKLIKYRHYLPWITGYLQQFIPKSVPDDEDGLDESINSVQKANVYPDGRIKDECMRDKRVVAYGLDKAIEVIECRKAIFAGFLLRAGAKSPLRLLATRSSLFDKQVMRLPLQLTTGIKQPQISEKAQETALAFLLS